MKQVRGMDMLVGEPGAGKTYALRAFTDSLNKSLYKVVYFPLSTGTVSDFYRGLAFGLGEEPKSRKVDLFRQIQQAVTTSFHERKVTPIFILDEMQMAKDLFLSDLNLLFNFQLDSSNPFILLLCGLPYLRDRLTLNHNRPLAQRLLMTHHMEPLSKDEVSGYVEHHMNCAGAKHPIFSDTAMEALQVIGIDLDGNKDVLGIWIALKKSGEQNTRLLSSPGNVTGTSYLPSSSTHPKSVSSFIRPI